MNGMIAALIGSSVPDDRTTVSKVFGPNFQSLSDWRSFIRCNLNGSVQSLLQAPIDRWTTRSFHALYVSCWLHHPVEKGSYMIDLGKLPRHQHESVFAAVRKVCIKRIGSSHLSKVGYSAREGWNFLKHYHELLIQCEETLGRPYLFLKAEGHTTGPSGIVPHLVSWAHKKWYGEGKTVSPDLNELALKSPELVSRRAAENYAVGYKALLKEVLHLKGKKVLVHELLAKLYSETGFKARTSISITSTSSEWGESLEQYCELATNPGPMRLTYTKDGKITPEMISDLRAIAKTLKSDPGDKLFPRVFEEIRTNASELDASISKFCEYQA